MKSTDVVQDPPVDPYWLDVPAAARYLCMTPHAIYHRINRRDIPFVRQGRLVRFDRHELDRWMRKGARNGFTETRRGVVLHEADQRPALSRVHRVRGQEVRRAARRGDRGRHPVRHSRLEEHDAELRGMVGGVPEDVHAPEVREEA
ncbi:MAG: helix-turn-helix domain-containing protein [Vicinamibacterales bacterium]